MISSNKTSFAIKHRSLKNKVNGQSLTDAYQQLLKTKQIKADLEQEKIVARLQRLTDLLIQADAHHQSSFLASFKGWFSSTNTNKWEKIKGLYLWGSVGTGKTLVINLFYDHLPIKEKLKINYHDFMHEVHESMKYYRGEANPLLKVADEIALFRVICLDEMHVTHISDAMILATLMNELFARGLILIITSNRHPDTLYKHGLQRNRFLPTIALIKQYTDVFLLNVGLDYRMSKKKQKESLYLDSNDLETNTILEAYFIRLSQSSLAIDSSTTIDINQRSIQVVQQADDIIWFTYNALCNSARSVEDYEVIAQRYSTVILQDIPLIDNTRADSGRRFINLIYILYDRKIKLIVSAAAKPSQLYIGGVGLRHPFLRTVSRLIEMQSVSYNYL